MTAPICPDCNGLGTITQIDRAGFLTVRCDTCDGEGRVEATCPTCEQELRGDGWCASCADWQTEVHGDPFLRRVA